MIRKSSNQPGISVWWNQNWYTEVYGYITYSTNEPMCVESHWQALCLSIISETLHVRQKSWQVINHNPPEVKCFTVVDDYRIFIYNGFVQDCQTYNQQINVKQSILICNNMLAGMELGIVSLHYSHTCTSGSYMFLTNSATHNNGFSLNLKFMLPRW